MTATIRSSATGTLTNTATASASDASTVTATDTDTLTAQATLAITKTDGVTSVTAGTTDTYTVVVSNTGPSDASNLSVVDTLPTQGFTNITSPNLPAGVTFNAATDTWTLASLPAGPVGHPPAGRHRSFGGHRVDLREHGHGHRPPTPRRSRPPTPTP